MSQRTNTRTTNSVLPFAVIAILIIFGIYWWGIPKLYSEPGQAGQFGDMFGALNTAFSGFALLGVVYSVILQSNELSLQRKEIEDNRKELARAAKAQEETENVLSRQLQLSVIAARLNALPDLLERQSDVVGGLCGIADINKLSDAHLKRYADETGERGQQVQRLFALRKEMTDLYEKLSRMESNASAAAENILPGS